MNCVGKISQGALLLPKLSQMIFAGRSQLALPDKVSQQFTPMLMKVPK